MSLSIELLEAMCFLWQWLKVVDFFYVAVINYDNQGNLLQEVYLSLWF